MRRDLSRLRLSDRTGPDPINQTSSKRQQTKLRSLHAAVIVIVSLFFLQSLYLIRAEAEPIHLHPSIRSPSLIPFIHAVLSINEYNEHQSLRNRRRRSTKWGSFPHLLLHTERCLRSPSCGCGWLPYWLSRPGWLTSGKYGCPNSHHDRLTLHLLPSARTRGPQQHSLLR